MSGRRCFDKLREFGVVHLLIYVLLVAVLIFSSWKVYEYFAEGKKEKDFNQSLIESAVTPVEKDGHEGDLSQGSENRILREPDITVDVAKLKSSYRDVVGWLYSPETPINYPIVQGNDNAYYVDRLPSGAANEAGSLFLDFRDAPDLSGFLQVVYGHNMKNNSMFGTILDYRREGYFEKHPYLFYFTENKTYRLEVFAGVNTHATTAFYDRPTNAEGKVSYLDSVRKNSTFESDVTVEVQDRILMLSTCSGAVDQSNRYVIFAKLVEIGSEK